MALRCRSRSRRIAAYFFPWDDFLALRLAGTGCAADGAGGMRLAEELAFILQPTWGVNRFEMSGTITGARRVGQWAAWTWQSSYRPACARDPDGLRST